MKRISIFLIFLLRWYLLLIFIICSSTANSMQVIIHSGQGVVLTNFENRIDYLVMMREITANTELTVVLSDDSVSVEWHSYARKDWTTNTVIPHFPPRFISNQSFLNPNDHTGYILRLVGTVNGLPYRMERTVWVIDYSVYSPVFNSLLPAEPSREHCTQLPLTLVGDVPIMHFADRHGRVSTIKRLFQLEYETLQWDSGWKPVSVVETVEIDKNTVYVNNPPYTNTRFSLHGDQFAKALGLSPFLVKSELYNAVRTTAKITSQTTIRTERNEGDRPDQITVLSGSAPLEVLFEANPNSPVVNFVRWEIVSGETVLVSRTDVSHRYTFNTAGTFTVKLLAENRWCSFRDSVIVKVSESALFAPNVFTPNGDGLNDEFRVAYRSIIQFKATIYNRWGKRIFEWTDPQRGWDGTYQGRPVPEGPYFYVITAKGADGEVYTIRGDINLLRGRK